MSMYVPTNIKITVRKDQPTSEGLYPIILHFTQNRRVKRISLRKYVHPNHWIDKGGQYVLQNGAKAPANGRGLNLFLNSISSKANDILLSYERIDEVLTFEDFKSQLIEIKSQDFIIFCEEELERRRQSGTYSEATLKSNTFKLGKLKRFAPKLSFHELTIKFLEKYETHMRMDLGNGVNTIFAAMKFIRTMLNSAIKQKLTKSYPFDDYKLTYKKNTRDRLHPEELDLLQHLYDEELLPDHLQHVLRYFLFACYTGLTWGDLVSLDYKEIDKKDKFYVIEKARQKTGGQFIVPLLGKAKSLINVNEISGKVFPHILTNQKSNASIKKIVKGTKIKKVVTFHVARHTFGTVALNHGISREAIQRMMGHAKEEMTQLYSKMLDTTIISEMKKWENNLISAEYKDTITKEALKDYRKIRTQLIATRIAGGLSISDMADKIGVDPDSYQEMEKGDLQIGAAQLIELSKILDIDLELLFKKLK